MNISSVCINRPVLATYRLDPESILAIQKRLAPPAISDTKVKLEEVERSLVPLNSQHRELSQLVPKKLAPPQSLAQVNQSRGVLQREAAPAGPRSAATVR